MESLSAYASAYMTSLIPSRNVDMCGCNKAKAAAARKANPAVAAPAAAAAPAAVVTHLETVDTSVWGAPLWKILHIAAQRSSARNSVPAWRSVLDAMKTGLPCPDCSAHYNAWYRSHPLRIGLMPNMFQGAIMRWILDLHNDVNRRTEKAKWNTHQMAATYGGEQVATAKALAESLSGILGSNLSGALNALLRTL